MFASKLLGHLSAAVLLASSSIVSAAATPVETSAAPTSSASVNSSTSTVLQLTSGIYEINFVTNNVIRSSLGNRNDKVTAIAADSLPRAGNWVVTKEETENVYTLSINEKFAVGVTSEPTIPLGQGNALDESWVITKPFNQSVSSDDWVILSPFQRQIFPPPQTGWKLHYGEFDGALVIEDHATVFTFVRIEF